MKPSWPPGIIAYPHLVLRTKAEPIDIDNQAEVDTAKGLADDMVQTMLRAGGIGLAAPQIGVSKRVVVMAIPTKEGIDVYKLANPELIIQDSRTTPSKERCLSFGAGFAGMPEIEIERYSKPKFKAYCLKQDKEIEFQPKAHEIGICLQHEIDHLNGVMIFDRLEYVYDRDKIIQEYYDLLQTAML